MARQTRHVIMTDMPSRHKKEARVSPGLLINKPRRESYQKSRPIRTRATKLSSLLVRRNGAIEPATSVPFILAWE